MSVRLRGHVDLPADAGTVFAALADWERQAEWIPLSTITVGAQRTGIGVRVRAVHGPVLGGRRVGLVDTFVTTGWVDATAERRGEIEVLHDGPVFTGVGAFQVDPLAATSSRFTVVEDFTLPWPVIGPVAEAGARIVRPLLQAGLVLSLRRFAATLAVPPIR